MTGAELWVDMKGPENIRMLVNEAASVVNLVVYYHEEVLLAVVPRHLIVCELLAIGHCVLPRASVYRFSTEGGKEVIMVVVIRTDSLARERTSIGICRLDGKFSLVRFLFEGADRLPKQLSVAIDRTLADTSRW